MKIQAILAERRRQSTFTKFSRRLAKMAADAADDLRPMRGIVPSPFNNFRLNGKELLT